MIFPQKHHFAHIHETKQIKIKTYFYSFLSAIAVGIERIPTT
jgi:hypothetical protein